MIFGIGFFMSNIFPPPDKKYSVNNYLDKALFILQKHCYAFFLVHGGVLVFLFEICNATFAITLFFGIALTIFGTIALNATVKTLRKVISKNKNEKNGLLIQKIV